MFALRRFNSSNPIVFGPWSLGRLGLPCNLLSIAFCIFLVIFLPFPPNLPVTAQNMNYASVVFGAVIVFSLVDWIIRGRRRFTGPIREIASETSSEVLDTSYASPEKAE